MGEIAVVVIDGEVGSIESARQFDNESGFARAGAAGDGQDDGRKKEARGRPIWIYVVRHAAFAHDSSFSRAAILGTKR
jgi:hypothetical protein